MVDLHAGRGGRGGAAVEGARGGTEEDTTASAGESLETESVGLLSRDGADGDKSSVARKEIRAGNHMSDLGQQAGERTRQGQIEDVVWLHVVDTNGRS